MNWVYSKIHKKPLLVMEEKTLWGEKILYAIAPDEKKVVSLPAEKSIPIGEKEVKSKEHFIYISCASRIAEALESHLLVSPLGSNLIPLPHQLNALSEAMSGDTVRFLLADEVGLGKTIEAGMIFKELKIRNLVKRVLIAAPKGLILQWIAEMKKHFAETFHLIIPGRSDMENLYKVYTDRGEETERLNYWKAFDQAVCSIDSVKPLEKRKGWSDEEIERYNRERFDNLLLAGWDLIIIDEAHRVAGSSQSVARHILGRSLSHCAPYILLLSATPHSGKSDSFRRLMSLLDEETFSDEESLTKEKVSSFVIRTEKRNAIDFRGEKLFKPRHTSLHFIEWKENDPAKKLYEAVTCYVRNGYNRAIREKNTAAGFLMVLLQRLVASSTEAIKTTLEKRLNALSSEGNLPEELEESLEEDIDFDEISDAFRIKMESEIEEVKNLLCLAEKCSNAGYDAKTEALLDLIYGLTSEEGELNLKFLIFTEFVATQKMLQKYLSERGFSVAILNGSLGLMERTDVQRDFAEKARVLISTDAGGEGINLQFCHIVINYDIPWAPAKLEQRIGRVDRIGQSHRVKAINFFFKDTVESRVYEVLQ
ncbi:MAG: helicase-related protein, partial [Candidatus Eremiobacterota bacterium]